MPVPKQKPTVAASAISLVPIDAPFLYGVETKQVYYEDQTVVGPSTYERVPSYQTAFGPAYKSPLDFATQETADAVLEWAQKVWPTVKWSLEPGGMGIGLMLFADNQMGRSEQYSAGRVAFSYDKNGPQWTVQSLNAQLKLAGIVF